MDEVGGVQANDVHAQDLASVLAVEQLGNAVALLLGQRLRSAATTERAAGD